MVVRLVYTVGYLEYSNSNTQDLSNINPIIFMKVNTNATKTLYIGLGVYKAVTVIDLLKSDRNEEPRQYGAVITYQYALERVMRRIAKSH